LNFHFNRENIQHTFAASTSLQRECVGEARNEWGWAIDQLFLEYKAQTATSFD
jgi:hypothetical protein